MSRKIALIRGLVRIYASDQCPRQDSNLRSRLRRGLLFTPLTSGNEFPHTMIGGVSGATASLIAGQVCRGIMAGYQERAQLRS